MSTILQPQKPTAGSLFSGIGGIDLAFSLAGFDILFQVEIDEFCQKVLAKHSKEYWPNAAIKNDVRAVGQHNLPAVDVLFGGFPCQDISRANNIRTGIENGERSGLWSEFLRIIGELRPRIVLVENVEGILSNGDGWRVIAELAALGYVGQAGIVSAADMGFSHIRERWFLVAYSDSFGQRQPTAAASGENSLHENGWDSIHQRQGDSIGIEAWRSSENRGANRQSRQSRMGISANGLPEWMARRVRGWAEPAQGWEAPRTTPAKHPLYGKAKEAIGNAVVPQVVYPIAVEIKKLLENGNKAR